MASRTPKREYILLSRRVAHGVDAFDVFLETIVDYPCHYIDAPVRVGLTRVEMTAFKEAYEERFSGSKLGNRTRVIL